MTSEFGQFDFRINAPHPHGEATHDSSPRASSCFLKSPKVCSFLSFCWLPVPDPQLCRAQYNTHRCLAQFQSHWIPCIVRSLPLGAQPWTPVVSFGLVLGNHQIRDTWTQGSLGSRCVYSGDWKAQSQWKSLRRIGKWPQGRQCLPLPSP